MNIHWFGRLSCALNSATCFFIKYSYRTFWSFRTQRCDSLNEKCYPESQVFKCLLLSWWHCLGRLRRCGPGWRNYVTADRLWEFIASPHLNSGLLPVLSACGWTRDLSAYCSSHCHAACHYRPSGTLTQKRPILCKVMTFYHSKRKLTSILKVQLSC